MSGRALENRVIYFLNVLHFAMHLTHLTESHFNISFLYFSFDVFHRVNFFGWRNFAINEGIAKQYYYAIGNNELSEQVDEVLSEARRCESLSEKRVKLFSVKCFEFGEENL